MRFRQERSVLITSAGQSRQWEIHRRELRYLASMGFRVVCFLLAVLVFHGWPRYLLVGVAVILPWVAVVVANGGPAPERGTPVTYDPVRAAQEAPAAIEASAHQVVDSDGWVDEAGWVHTGPSTGGTQATGQAEDGSRAAGPDTTGDAGVHQGTV
ncbi:DUF3099 domain-containing protein [Frankia sp. AgPm24]|uniref:DUF3099 domain-containing protein n=1 Tax=Frankia sp. AgPm24 TaxID=631128 RepID=UPI002010720E|nr:DUF3099 domain-containing protein [Frankia sp. AgPm24]MCK9924625.1 DUF3099 domain-containing protein [Frankia sp. AgPm24]